MNLLWLFDTCGYIVGPAILAAGLLAIGLCLWASRPSTPRRGRRRALVVAASPAAVGLGGAAFGFVIWWTAGAQGAPWAALGKVCLAGAVGAPGPLAWAVLLPRSGRGSGGSASVEGPA